MKEIFKKKRVWIGLGAIATAGYYFAEGNYPAAVSALLNGLGLGG